MSGKKIGILTGGGDVPGLNVVIKNVVYRSSSDGHDVTGIRLGWKGLTDLNFDDPESVKRFVLPLNRENTRTIDRSGGTFLAYQPHQSVEDEKASFVFESEGFPDSADHKRRRDLYDV